MRLVYLYLYTEISEKVNKLRNENYIETILWKREWNFNQRIGELTEIVAVRMKKKAYELKLKKEKEKKSTKLFQNIN